MGFAPGSDVSPQQDRSKDREHKPHDSSGERTNEISIKVVPDSVIARRKFDDRAEEQDETGRKHRDATNPKPSVSHSVLLIGLLFE
jgi:hypothetical protein